MNLLLISFAFPPVGGVGVLRALSLAKYLPESGIRVDVLTARNAPGMGRDESLLRQVPGSVTVHRVWTLDLPFGVRKAVKHFLARGGSPKKPSTAAPRASSARSLRSKLSGLVGNLLLPDPQIGWLPFALPAARHIIRTRNIDAVLLTAPPFSTLKLIPRLRKSFPNLRIIVDFRDEWITSTLSLWSFNNSDRAQAIAHATERDAVKAASTVVLVTRAAVDELRKRYPEEPPSKFVWIPNGYDIAPTNTQRPTREPDAKVTFVYLGSVYGSTDPRNFIAAVANLPENVRAQLRIRFIGRIESQVYRDAIDSLGSTAEIVGFLPQSEALNQLGAADYALLITHDPINVSAKLYDYLGSGLPIFAVVDPNSDARRLIEETRSGRWADIHDIAMITQTLTEAVEAAQRSSGSLTPDADLVASYHRRPITQKYAALLQSSAPH